MVCRDRRTGYDGIEGKKETLTFRTVSITDRKFHEENVEWLCYKIIMLLFFKLRFEQFLFQDGFSFVISKITCSEMSTTQERYDRM